MKGQVGCKEIECHHQVNHSILKRGHSNALEASNYVFIRFGSKDIALERLHYHVSTNLALLEAYIRERFGTTGFWNE